MSSVKRGRYVGTRRLKSSNLIFMSTPYTQHRYCTVIQHTHTCRGFSLWSGGERTVAEGCEAISPLARFDIPIVSIHQDLPQSFSLTVEHGR